MNKQIKRSFAVLLAILMLASSVPFAVFGAGCPDGNHDFGEWKITYPTCTEKGSETRTCKNCSTKETKSLKAYGHDVEGVQFVIDKAATCKEEGSKCQICRRCKAKVNVTAIPKTEHNFTKDPSAQYLKSAANCASPAVYYYKCKDCGVKTDTTYENGEPNPNNHTNLVAVGEGKKATCDEKGLSEGKKCADCGKEIEAQKELDKLVHEIGTPATCTTLATCKNCGKSFGVLDLNNHANLETNPAVEATCTTPGKTEGKTCKDCGTVVVRQEDTSKIAHKEEVIPAVEATCTADGLTAGAKCTVCETITKEPVKVDKLGHDTTDWIYPDDYNCTKGANIYKNCKRCGAEKVKTDSVPAKTHTLVLVPEVPATCLEPGKTAGEQCSECGFVSKNPVEIPVLEHDYSGEAKSNENGTHYFKCVNGCDTYGATASLNCSDMNGDCLCDACGFQLAHQYGDFVSDNNATCIADGTKTHTCQICGNKETVVDEDSKATGDHKFSTYVYDEGTATCTTDGSETATCELCGIATHQRIKESSALGHKETGWMYPDSFACEEGGIRYKLCERCSQMIDTETVAPGAHTEIGDEEVPATCTEKGKTAGSHCEVCGLVIIPQLVVPETGHSYIATIIKEATCKEAGYASYTCASCGHTYEADVPSLPHSGEWEIIKTATCSNAGLRTRTCTVCATTETEEIAKLGHKEVVDKGTPATCLKTGVSDGKHCTVCGKKTVEQYEIPATGHTKKVVTTPATVKKAGKTVTSCSVCGKSLKKVVIAKIKSVTLSQTTFEYNGKAQKPTVTVKDSNGTKLKEKTDYTLKYSSGRKKIGSYSVIVTFKGNYSGTKTLKFTVSPMIVTGLKVTAGKKSATLKWSQAKYAGKYVIYCATSKNGVYTRIGSTDKLKFEATGLKTGKTYYFYVKSVKSNSAGNFYAEASAIKKATIK